MNLIEKLKADGRVIFECVSGSHAYGTSTPESDLDIRGVFMLPKADVVSLFDPPQEAGDDKQDVKYYELKKFLNLAAQCNPNIVELLFPPDDTVRIMTPAMQRIIDNRALFVSRRACITFSGYAYAQIEKAKGQNKLIHNPKPKEKPCKEDFCWFIPYYERNCPPCRPIPLKQSGAALSMCHAAQLEHVPDCYRIYFYGNEAKGVFRGEGMLFCESIPIHDEKKFTGLLIYKKNEFEKELKSWKNYWDWVEKRNASRWVQQERGEIDYDAKNMMHCFRLLMSGRNILERGEPIIMFSGEELKFLMDVRRGKFEYSELISRAERELEELKTLKEQSHLPYSADMKKIDALYKEIQEMAH